MVCKIHMTLFDFGNFNEILFRAYGGQIKHIRGEIIKIS